MTDPLRDTSAVKLSPSMIDQQLGLLIDQLATVLGVWPATVEFGIMTLAISYVARRDRETLAELLECEVGHLRHTGPITREMAGRYHALIDTLMRNVALGMSDVRGSA